MELLEGDVISDTLDQLGCFIVITIGALTLVSIVATVSSLLFF